MHLVELVAESPIAAILVIAAILAVGVREVAIASGSARLPGLLGNRSLLLGVLIAVFWVVVVARFSVIFWG